MEGNAIEQQNVSTAVIVDDVQAPTGLDLGDIRVRWRSFLPGRPTIWHRATLSHLAYTHVTAEKRLADMQAALHAAGQELGEANRQVERQLERDRALVAENDSLRRELADARSLLANVTRMNENQARTINGVRQALIDTGLDPLSSWSNIAVIRQRAEGTAALRDALAKANTVNENVTAMYREAEAARMDLVNKLADAEQRIAGMEADLAATSADEAEGDEILGDRVEFEDVDTYSELATEAVRLADEVQDLKARQSNSVVWLVIDEETTLAAEEKAHRLESSLREVTTERDKLRGKLEVERMRLTACDVAARANTRESAANELAGVLPEYRSAALDSVVRAVEREMNWRERAKKLEGELGLERLKSDMERTRARLAEGMATVVASRPDYTGAGGALTVGVGAPVPPPQTPVTATKVPGWKSLTRIFPNTFLGGR